LEAWLSQGALSALLIILLLSLLLSYRNRALRQRSRELAASAEQLLAATRIQRLVAERIAALMSVSAAGRDAAIGELLEAIGRLLEADRSYLFQATADGQHCNNTHEWCAEGISAQQAANQNVPMSVALWWWQHLGDEGRIVIDDVSALPAQAADLKQVLQAQQIRSLFAFSLFKDRPEHGFVGIDLVREQRVWDLALLSPFEALISALGDALLRWQAETELSENQRFLDTLFESIPVPVFCKDAQGRYIRVNRGFEQFFGAERDALLGKRATDLNPPELARIYEEQDRRLLSAGGRQRYAAQVRNTSGRLREVIFDKAVFGSEQTPVAGLIGTVLDVTEVKRQERSLKLRAQRDEALLRLPQAADELGETAFMQRAQEIAEDLTQSQISFIHFVAEDQQTIELITWSRRTLDHYCEAIYHRHYPVPDAGIWADALRRREPVMVNDYAGYPRKHGLPEGHAALHRFISVPVMEDGRVVMLTGVGNKPVDYDATDVESVQLISNQTWNLVQRRRNQRRLERSASVFSHAREGILVAAPDGDILDVNDAFVQLIGYPREELIGQNPRLFKSARHGRSFYAELWQSLLVKGFWRGQIWNRRKDGEQRAMLLTISAVRQAGVAVTEFVALYSDITEQIDYQHQLEHAAHFDALTQLPNRVLLADRLRQALVRARRHRSILAVLYLDLDGFKEVNDHYGHDQGDRLLREVTQRMRACLREVDTLARPGGDEFIAVLIDLPTEQAVMTQLNRLRSAVSQPIDIESHTVQLSVSIGVTFYPQRNPVDEDLLLRQADQAMYQAKLAGRNRYLLFDAEQELDQSGRLQHRDRLRLALQRDELCFFYQPKVNLRSGEVIGAEALLRWRHPERGLLAPGDFLSQSADKPLMIEIGELALTQALKQLDDWAQARRMLSLSVNIHAHHLQQAGFVSWLSAALARHPGFAPGRLTLEILETGALEDLSLIKRVIEDCHQLGVQLSLDDFGTGYSSLAYLRNLPAAEIKIDTSFVRGALTDPEDLAIVEGVLGLASAFQRRVVAEGVETLEHGKLLLALGCELAQGYAIARPMAPADFEDWLGCWQPPRVWRETPAIAREDVTALFAIVEHRSWVARLEQFAGSGGEAPKTDPEDCRFGRWLRAEAQVRYGDCPSFAALGPLHRLSHQIARAMLEALRSGNAQGVALGLDKLRAARDRLHETLLRMLQEKANR
jgi:diguanylate cyclase (GGDEF)-like protein/PAS domain S-box-containing protein